MPPIHLQFRHFLLKDSFHDYDCCSALHSISLNKDHVLAKAVNQQLCSHLVPILMAGHFAKQHTYIEIKAFLSSDLQ